jgi:hypothetical protein
MNRWTKRLVWPAIAFGFTATLGCATSYTPRPSHRISFTESGLALRLTHDSQTFSIWDVDRAVVGNPRAEDRARTYKNRTTAGLILDAGGVGMIVGGAVLEAPANSPTRQREGGGLIILGLASITTAVALIMTGVPHLYDAVNIYNDGLPPEPPTP